MFTRWSLGIKSGRIFKQIGFGAVLLLMLLGLSALFTGVPANAQNPNPMQPMEEQNIYMPLIPAGGGTPTPPPLPPGTAATSGRVYGLMGQLEQPTGQRYTYYLRTPDNAYYALAGETPEIEQQIATLARTAEYPNVKVWGEIQPPEPAGQPPLIVVSGILGTETAMPTPVSGASVPVAVVKFDVVNLYAGPASNYPVVGSVELRQACEVTGRNQAGTWLQLTCPDGQQGWIDARLVEVDGSLADVLVINLAAPVPTPTVATATPTPSPSPAVFTGWRTELFANSTLAGSAAAVVDVPNINFNWGAGGPSQVPADNFSIRFSRRISVVPAFYQFTAQADDGIRVWVDGRLIINAWPANPSQNYVAGQILTGSHDVVVEYYEQSGLASVRMDYAPASDESYWNASYYYGVNPTGNSAFEQQEPRGPTPLDYNWGTGSPQSTSLGPNVLGNDYFSARWVGEFNFEDGNYVFRATVDDGIRLYLDGLLVLDQWRDGYKDVNNRVIGIGSGQHTVTIEYYERTGNASIRAFWYRDSAYVGPQ